MPVVEGDGPRHVVVDSTGVKVYGEGNGRCVNMATASVAPGANCILGVDESTGEILAAVVSTNNVSDDEAFGDLLDGIEGEIEAVSADGAYDKRKCYDAIEERGADAHIPPPPPERMPNIGRRRGETHARNQNPQSDEEVGRAEWKRESGYHRRSLAETMMFSLQNHLWRHLLPVVPLVTKPPNSYWPVRPSIA